MRTTPLKLSFTLSSTWKKLQSILWMKKSAHFTLKDCIYWRILYKAWYTCWLSNNGQGYKYRIIYCWYTKLSALNANEMKIIKSKTILNFTRSKWKKNRTLDLIFSSKIWKYTEQIYLEIIWLLQALEFSHHYNYIECNYIEYNYIWHI